MTKGPAKQSSSAIYIIIMYICMGCHSGGVGRLQLGLSPGLFIDSMVSFDTLCKCLATTILHMLWGQLSLPDKCIIIIPQKIVL